MIYHNVKLLASTPVRTFAKETEILHKLFKWIETRQHLGRPVKPPRFVALHVLRICRTPDVFKMGKEC